MFEAKDQRAPVLIARRVKVFQPATLYLGRIASRIHLLDLSLTGAMAHAPEPPEEGARISVECADTHILARVVWRRGNRFGISFIQSLSECQALHMAGMGVPA